MIFIKTKLEGVFLIELDKREDDRGFFARFWDKKQFEDRGLSSKIQQCSISFNEKQGTVRGMHYQVSPYEEEKIVCCIKGKIYDVVIDLRPQSPTYNQWESFELNSMNYQMIYIPKGFAHGYQTLEDNTEVFYLMSEIYEPSKADGIRWNDPAFSIPWPCDMTKISERDKSFLDYKVENK